MTFIGFDRIYNWLRGGAPMAKTAPNANGWQSITGEVRQNYKLYKNSRQNDLGILDALLTLSEVYSPIAYYANNAAKVKAKIYDKTTGEEIENHPLSKLFKHPNYYQGEDEFNAQTFAAYKLFGNAYEHYIFSNTIDFGQIPTSLFSLPPQYMSIAAKDDKFNISFVNNEILKYYMKIEGISDDFWFEQETVLHHKSLNMNFIGGAYLYGQSPLLANQYDIESLFWGKQASMNLYQNHPPFLLSPHPENNTSVAPDADDVEIEQERLSRYGLTNDKYKILLTRLPMQAQRLGLNVNELQLNETNTAAFQNICRNLGINSLVLGDVTSATFANKEQAEQNFYNGEFVSTVNKIYQNRTEYFNKFIGLENIEIKPDYSNIPQLQDNINDKVENYQGIVERGLMTRNEYLKMIGLPEVDKPEYDEYYSYNASQSVWTPLTQNISYNEDNL